MLHKNVENFRSEITKIAIDESGRICVLLNDGSRGIIRDDDRIMSYFTIYIKKGSKKKFITYMKDKFTKNEMGKVNISWDGNLAQFNMHGDVSDKFITEISPMLSNTSNIYMYFDNSDNMHSTKIGFRISSVRIKIEIVGENDEFQKSRFLKLTLDPVISFGLKTHDFDEVSHHMMTIMKHAYSLGIDINATVAKFNNEIISKVIEQ